VTTGTDALDEFAYALDLLLPADVAVAVTGAAKPLHVEGYDGRANCGSALRVLAAPGLRPWRLGVVVVHDDTVHAARYVRKADTGLVGGMFQSHPGPLAQVRSAVVHCFYPALPPLARLVDVRLAPDTAVPRVGLWTMTVGAAPPTEAEAVAAGWNGLVVAGMGTGSVSAAVADALATLVTARRIPVVLVSRVPVGLNYDDVYYVGSVAKYEARGLTVRDGYEGLSPYQARLRLLFALLRRNDPATAS
jgi:L-asparaginase